MFLLVEQLDQLEVCLPYSRLLAGIPILVAFKYLRWNSNKTSLLKYYLFSVNNECSDFDLDCLGKAGKDLIGEGAQIVGKHRN